MKTMACHSLGCQSGDAVYILTAVRLELHLVVAVSLRLLGRAARLSQRRQQGQFKLADNPMQLGLFRRYRAFIAQ